MSNERARNDRAFLRWEFVRRNRRFKKLYLESFPKSKSLYALPSTFGEMYPIGNLAQHDKEVKERDELIAKFLGEFFVYPLNPDFDYEKVLERYRKLEKYFALGKPSPGYVLLSEYLHVKTALEHLHTLHLTPGRTFEYRTVIRSYLTENKNIVLKRKDGNGLVNVSSFPGVPVMGYKGNVLRVTFELDLSYPQQQVIEDIKKEITLWSKTVKNYISKTRQRVYVDQLNMRGAVSSDSFYSLIKVYEFRESGIPFSKIAMKFDRGDIEGVQKMRDIYKKAKGFIEGGYKEIR